MTLAELLTGLATVILGLAVSNITSSLHRLALTGRKVRWAPEPVLLTTLLIMILVNVWLGFWAIRDAASVNEGRTLLTLVQLMTLYFAAASCLPEPDRIPAEGIDLKVYYYETRWLSYGAMAFSLALISVRALVTGQGFTFVDWFLSGGFPIALYLLLCLVRKRWIHLAVLLFVNVAFGYQVITTTHH